ncbi:MAG: tetratricopeptide repeat protein [Chloroflexi bacterium]|nr:tetratricopeptide repeat protein [Chloroflexota bacterium]
MSTATIPDIEPTPEFNTRCLAIVQEWQRGLLPYADAWTQLADLEQEAAASNHLVNQGRVEQLFGYIKSYRGELNAAIHHYERARALYNQAGNQRRVGTCDLNMGEAYRYKGNFKRARELYEKAYQAFKQVGDREGEALAIGNKGQMLLSMGLLDSARADLEEGYRIAVSLPADEFFERNGILCETHHALALLYLAQGNLQTAWEETQRALEIAQATREPLETGFAYRAIAEVLTAGYRPGNGFSTDPDMYYQLASEAFSAIHAEGEIARTMFAQAKSLARRGRRMTAARKLQLAMGIFTKLGMVDDAAKAAEAQLEVL